MQSARAVHAWEGLIGVRISVARLGSGAEVVNAVPVDKDREEGQIA